MCEISKAAEVKFYRSSLQHKGEEKIRTGGSMVSPNGKRL